MSASGWFERDAALPDIARGYTGEGKDRRWNYDMTPQKGSSAGGGYATAMDLFRFARFVANDPATPASYPGRNGLGIAGGADGINAALEWNGRNGYIVIVLANLDPPAAEKLAQRLIRAAPAGR